MKVDKNAYLYYIDNEKLTTRLYDKRDDFNFPRINFPFLSSNIPSAPAYVVYVSQRIRYARACIEYQDSDIQKNSNGVNT